MAKRKPAKTPPPPKRRGVGRPRLEVNESVLQNLAAIGCSKRTAAFVLGISEDTLQRNFAAIFDASEERGKMQILSAAWDQGVIKRDSKLIIFLLKNRCGYSEKSEIKQDNSGEIRVIGQDRVKVFQEAAKRARQEATKEKNGSGN